MAYGLGAQPIASYLYGHDVGSNSDDAIIAFAKTSGIPVNVTAIAPDRQPSHLDDGGYHSTHNAVDFSGALNVMDSFSAWVIKYAPFILELIHASASAPGGGYFVHNGQVVGSGVYSAVLADHYNHVHLAMTPSGLSAASNGAVLTGLPNPLDPLDTVKQLADAISKGAGFFKLISDPYTYKRLAYGIGGVILVAVGMMIIVDTRNLRKVGEALGIPTSQRSVTRAVKQRTGTKSGGTSSNASSTGGTTRSATPKPIPDSGKTFEYPNKSRKLGETNNPYQNGAPLPKVHPHGKGVVGWDSKSWASNPKQMEAKGLKNVQS